MKIGCPPTPPNARAGLLTPPGMSWQALAKAVWLWVRCMLLMLSHSRDVVACDVPINSFEMFLEVVERFPLRPVIRVVRKVTEPRGVFLPPGDRYRLIHDLASNSAYSVRPSGFRKGSLLVPKLLERLAGFDGS